MLYKHLTSSIFSRCTLSAKLVHCASLVIVSDFSDYNLQLVLILRNAWAYMLLTRTSTICSQHSWSVYLWHRTEYAFRRLSIHSPPKKQSQTSALLNFHNQTVCPIPRISQGLWRRQLRPPFPWPKKWLNLFAKGFWKRGLLNLWTVLQTLARKALCGSWHRKACTYYKASVNETA